MGMLMLCFLMFEIEKQDTIVDLDQLKWKNRIVLFFPKEKEFDYDFTDSLLVEIKDRKIVYIIFNEEIESNREVNISDKYLNELTSKYKMGSRKDCWILIGLDGGVKLKEESKPDWRLILQTVDTMPMRIRETRNNL
ncbi:DUF4174 domain-containing protein [Belliella sp. R4-6]|uniref:DUF4174 domain-containing protein n=1 Tax=Belliella alkalica TaxID=1730871 RepID=A0ABS9VG24_9BACT|nr:DUF4174 domain-containing protein [Belliella alkalica]MCH7415394.1 DUF4174 domain-containing protein [Belliella alkalica]